MRSVEFTIKQKQLDELRTLYPNMGKNSDVGKLAVEISKLYFLSINPNTAFVVNKKGIDVATNIEGMIENYEIKETTDKDISWNKLKVSSQSCFNHLTNGLTMIRITNIGNKNMTIYFLRYKVDYELIPEPRWSVVQLRNK